MMISDEQVEQVLAFVRSGGTCGERTGCVSRSLSPDLAERIEASMAAAPDVRSDRLERARTHLAGGTVSADEVASKLIGRVVSDSLR
jgi:hypothetical protein